MQRFHLTLALGVGAALAALVAPELSPAKSRPAPDRSWTGVEMQRDVSGALEVRSALSDPVVAGGEERFLVVEVQGLEPSDPEPVDLCLAIDRSGSMSGDRMRLAQSAAAELANSLGPEDRIGLVSFASQARIDAELGGEGVGRAIWSLEASGNTAVHDGLQLARATLAAETGPRRVVLLSDGAANVGPSSAWELGQVARGAFEQGVSVTAIGLGTGIDPSALMAVADAGGGRYHYLSEPGQLVAAFEEELQRLQSLSASGVVVDLDVAEGVEILEVYGYESWDGYPTPAGWQARIGDVSAGETRKVVARVRVPEQSPRRLAEVAVRWSDGQSQALWQPLLVQEHRGTPPELAWADEHVARVMQGRRLWAESEELRLHGGEEEMDLANLQALEALGYLE